MIKKIICPTDFSPSAQNAVAYAAKLCQLSGAGLELLNVQPILPHEMLSPLDIRRKGSGQVSVITDELEKMCYEINKAFHVSCSYDIDLTAYLLEDAIGMEAESDSLIVVGTNGADDLFQQFFGSNALNLVKKACCPVIVIPENVPYGTIQRIVFAWGYDTKDHNSFEQLKEYARMFNSEILFLHISKHESQISHDVFHALEETTEELFENKNVKFKRIAGEDIQEKIDFYMNEVKPAILAMVLHKGRLLHNIFQKGKGLRSLPTYPVLIFQHYL